MYDVLYLYSVQVSWVNDVTVKMVLANNYLFCMCVLYYYSNQSLVSSSPSLWCDSVFHIITKCELCKVGVLKDCCYSNYYIYTEFTQLATERYVTFTL